MNAGWRNGGIGNGSGVLYKRDDLSSKLPMSAGIGIFGMTGLAAYCRVKRILKPKARDTILVSGAAGGVGTVAGQIGKILQCRVIGVEKIKFIKSVGYDDAFNYKTETVNQALQRLAPDGVDGYFDNVGGDAPSEVLSHMKRKGKVAVCGAISSYNATEPVRALTMQPMLYSKSISMEGFNMVDCTISPRDDEIYAVLRKWVDEGKLQQYEYLTEGFESLPSAFIQSFCREKILGRLS